MRPARWLIAVLLFAPAGVAAQTGQGSVTLRATVSETVALQALPNSIRSDVVADVVSSAGNTVRITLSGNETRSQVIHVPLLVRSNSGFKISAVFDSQTAELDQISAIGVHATGRLVSPQLVNNLDIRRDIDPDTSRPLLVLSGPRISLGGTLVSPNNALQVTLLIRVKPQSATGWQAHLTLAATAESLIQ